MDERILRCIDDSHAVPSPPQVVTRLLEVTGDPDFERRDVVRVLVSDPGIASDIVRLANSALYRTTNKTATLDDAIGRLGIKRIRKLVVARSLVTGMVAMKSPLIDTSYFWRRSLGTGVLAAHFADALELPERDSVFLAGLLSDIGVVILAHAVPEEYRDAANLYAPKAAGDFVADEQRTLGTSHAEVGALAVERWSLPQELVLAIRHHHDDAFKDVPESVAKTARVVNAAWQIAGCLCEASDRARVREACTSAMQAIGVDVSLLTAILKGVESEVNEFAAVLMLDIIPSKVYALIAESVSEQMAPAAV